MTEFSVCGLALTPDDQLLWKFQPSQSVLTCLNSIHVNVAGQTVPTRYTVNSHGFRGEELHSGPKLLFLGCSCTFGTAINDWDTCPALTGKKLGVQCINAGVPGYGPFQCAHLWPRIVSEHDILAVIWQKPELQRFPWRPGYGKRTWEREKDAFRALEYTNPALWKRMIRIATASEVGWFSDLGSYCLDRGVPYLMFTHEICSEEEQYVAINEVSSRGLVTSLSSSLRSLLDVRQPNATFDQHKYFATPLDGHPNRLYNDIQSDLIAAHLRRTLSRKIR